MNDQPQTSAREPLIALRGITKAFPGVVALDRVDLTLYAGEVLALTGENGSGKSTLARCINGSVRPDAGTIVVDGVERTIPDPRAALRLGVVTISQELTLASTLTVAENIFLGRLPRTRGRVDWRLVNRRAAEILDRLDVHVDPTMTVSRLSVEMQQEVEIARAISSDARLLILDEATSSLSEAATQRLLDVVEELRIKDVAVLMISHRMPELYAAATRATVLRDGRLVGDCPLPETTEQRLVSMMVGRELGDYYGKREIAQGDVVLEVHELASLDGALKPTSLKVRKGEILGVAGLVGSGKAELGMALGGAIPCTGSAVVNGKQVNLGDPRSTLAGGIGFVPDDRKRLALLPTRSVGENFSIAWNQAISNKAGVLDTRRERKMVRDAITKYGVVTASAASRITTLSGGNQQKVVVGRIFALGVEVLVFSEPTRGIDVGAKSEIYHLMQEAASAGAAIVLISSELPELLGISDRIVVFFGGELRGEFTKDRMQEEDIAHVAVTGAPVLSIGAQTSMETS
ncbi:sugar ABC transporter ATP-binding protein [Capillimicrobium parvum]|uniref:Ribose import ATP-binding protein RbsA n=1 Tax=Capillimicrobium parvum TaxID=2884022 RepID=A0A9E6XS71_9ACTN|nr:sugar ABC transporter ATP-binding protein [Capillimicrobium parvum]UGS33819.1 Ribose import ATP-binding protein RbsA [Capillimicrobium parvum]